MKVNNIGNKAINAAKWASITEVASKIVTPITNMILARILVPEAFGVVAVIAMIISFADMFADAGFQKYLVQHEFVDEDEKYKNANVAFWTNFGISTFLWIVIIILRGQIAVSVGIPELDYVIAVSCIQLLFTPFSSIQTALFRREFDFKTLFMVRMVSFCIPFVITIPLALLGLSYWSLIIGTACIQISNAVILTFKSQWKPKLFYSKEILKEMLSFSIWSLIEAISIWFTVWIDLFIVANSFDHYYLGIYRTSIYIVNSLMGLIVASTVPVLFSTLSRLKNDDSQFKHMFFKTQQLVSILVFPLGVGVYLYSDLARKILLGSQWSEAGGVIGVYALTNSIIIVFGYYCSEVYRAKGRPRLSFLAQLLHLIVLVPACIISARYGFWAFVYTRSWIIMEFVLVHLIIMKVEMGVTILNTIRNVSPTLVSSISMGILGYLLQQISSGLLWSIISIILCSLFYFAVLYLFADTRKEIRGIAERLKAKLINGSI